MCTCIIDRYLRAPNVDSPTQDTYMFAFCGVTMLVSAAVDCFVPQPSSHPDMQ
jgi:hypothetical protein